MANGLGLGSCALHTVAIKDDLGDECVFCWLLVRVYFFYVWKVENDSRKKLVKLSVRCSGGYL